MDKPRSSVRVLIRSPPYGVCSVPRKPNQRRVSHLESITSIRWLVVARVRHGSISPPLVDGGGLWICQLRIAIDTSAFVVNSSTQSHSPVFEIRGWLATCHALQTVVLHQPCTRRLRPDSAISFPFWGPLLYHNTPYITRSNVPHFRRRNSKQPGLESGPMVHPAFVDRHGSCRQETSCPSRRPFSGAPSGSQGRLGMGPWGA